MQEVNRPGVRWEWISEAWNLFTKQWSTWVVMILVMYLVIFALYLPFIGVITLMAPTPEYGEPVEFPVGIFALYPVFYLALLAAVSWLFSGLYSAAFKQLRGEQISVGVLFSGGPYFVRVLGALLLIAIAAGIGSVFCLIPGLIVYGLAFLTYPMIVEGGKGTIEAIKASIEVTKKDLVMFTIFAVALYFIAGAGALACGVGVLATAPLLFLTHALAYRDLVGIHGAQPSGQFAPPDYGSYSPSQTPYAPPDYGSYTPPPPTPSAPPQPDYRPYTPSQTPSQPQQQTPSQTPPPPPAPSWAAPTTVTPAVSESATKTCPHCGATLARVVNFCNQCGRPLRNA
jgi:hypothetical protein